MILNTKDWKRLKQPIYLLLTMLLAISICIYLAQAFCQTKMELANTQQRQLQAMRANMQASESQKKDIEKFLPEYEALIAQGFIGEEHRNTWIDALSDIQKTHQLFDIKYELGHLETFNPTYLSHSAPFTLHKSTMKLNFDLLHEGDLLTLTEALKVKKLSAWMLKSCELVKANALNSPPSRLHAKCEIEWLTLSEPPLMQSTTSP